MVNAMLTDRAHEILSKTKRYLQVVRGRKNSTLSNAVEFLFDYPISDDVKTQIESRAYVKRRLRNRREQNVDNH